DRVDHDHRDDEDHDERKAAAAARGRALAYRNTVERDVSRLCDPLRVRGDAGEQAAAVVAPPEIRRHREAAGLTRETVRDDAFEVVADLGPHLSILDG